MGIWPCINLIQKKKHKYLQESIDEEFDFEDFTILDANLEIFENEFMYYCEHNEILNEHELSQPIELYEEEIWKVY